MRNYDLTIENGVITWIENTAENGNPIEGTLYIPKEATSFSADAWAALGCDTEGIRVHKDNPIYSSAHNCLLSKDGTKLIKTSKTSDISKLPGLKTIGRDAFQTLGENRDEFIFRIPDGVEVLDYRAFAVNADRVEIIVPASVIFVNLLAFMIHSKHTHIVFEGDADLRIGSFGTAAEARTPVLKSISLCLPSCTLRQNKSQFPARLILKFLRTVKSTAFRRCKNGQKIYRCCVHGFGTALPF